jgi:hypothetical protein
MFVCSCSSLTLVRRILCWSRSVIASFYRADLGDSTEVCCRTVGGVASVLMPSAEGRKLHDKQAAFTLPSLARHSTRILKRASRPPHETPNVNGALCQRSRLAFHVSAVLQFRRWSFAASVTHLGRSARVAPAAAATRRATPLRPHQPTPGAQTTRHNHSWHPRGQDRCRPARACTNDAP